MRTREDRWREKTSGENQMSAENWEDGEGGGVWAGGRAGEGGG